MTTKPLKSTNETHHDGNDNTQDESETKETAATPTPTPASDVGHAPPEPVHGAHKTLGISAAEKLSLSALRLDQSFESGAVKKVITTIKVEKPNRQTFVRVHPSEQYRITTLVLEYEREAYVLAPDLRAEVGDDAKAVTLFTCVTRDGNLFLWPVKMPTQDGRTNDWNESAMRAAELGQKKWVRVTSNMKAGQYDLFEPVGQLPDPTWPELTFDEIITIAFRNRYITTPDHPALRALRGEV